ncbi:hypothetical protein K3495_g15693 [Podosphaera aphanis]|nr:hypothetical protein K3495_g15693 [Podosphaera aphanis]
MTTVFSEKGKENQGERKIKGKGKSRGKQSGTVSKVFFDSDEESINDIDAGNSKVARISSASLDKNPLLYDTGASHHFVRSKHDFLTLAKLRKSFKFDQAIGTSVLTHQGTSCVRIGNEILELKESLYSPNSTCTIIFAGRLKEQHGIVAASANELLVKMENNQPVARLVAIENVLFIKPLRERERATFSSNIVAPGVARVPQITNAHRWHQRLGHTGQQILKKTMQCSLGWKELISVTLQRARLAI